MRIYNVSRASFWNELNNYIDQNMQNIFTMSCLNKEGSDWDPIFPAEQDCIDFEKQGMITNQVHTAQLHIQAGLEIARIQTKAPDVAKQTLRTVQSNRRMYFRLLAASLSNFITYRERFVCDQILKYPKYYGETSWVGVDQCPGSCCCGFGDHYGVIGTYSLADSITGLAIENYTGCELSYCPPAYNQKKDQCATKRFPTMCADSDFNTFYGDWEQNITFGIGAMIRSFQITFAVTENSTCGRPENRMLSTPTPVSLEGCQSLCSGLLSCDGFQFELPNATAVNGICKLSNVPSSLIGLACPAEGCGEGYWCNSADNKCYEACFSTAERCGNDIPRRSSYQCNYSPDTRPTCGTTNPNCPGQDIPCSGVPLPSVANWGQLAKNQYCSSSKSFNGYAGIGTIEECAAKCPDCNAISIDHSTSACKVWQDCTVSVTLTDTTDTFYFKEEATTPGRLDGLTKCGMMRIDSPDVQ